MRTGRVRRAGAQDPGLPAFFESLEYGHRGYCGTCQRQCAQITCIGETKAYFPGTRTCETALQQRCPTAEFQSLEPPIGAPGTIQGAGVGQFELFHRQDFFRLRMSPAATILRHTCLELGSHSLCPAAICNDHVWEAGAQAMCWGYLCFRTTAVCFLGV